MSVLLASVVLAVSPTASHHRVGCDKLFTVRQGERAARRIYHGERNVTLRNLRLLGYIERCQRNPAAQGFIRSYDHRQSALHQNRKAAARQLVAFSSSTLSDVPGVPSGFAACVAFKESTDGKLSPNIYGLLSYYSGESLAQQKMVMAQMYAVSGVQPWRPYDHC